MLKSGVLTRRKCAGKWPATFWDPCSQFSVTGNCQIFNFHDFLHFWTPTGGPRGSPPMGSLGHPRVPLPWGSWNPSHGIPFGPPRVPSPMGLLPWNPFGRPRVPPHGVPPHPIPFRFPPLHPIVRRARPCFPSFSMILYAVSGFSGYTQ